jgi:hypothetical protein
MLLDRLARLARALARIGLPRELGQMRKASLLEQLAAVGVRDRHG